MPPVHVRPLQLQVHGDHDLQSSPARAVRVTLFLPDHEDLYVSRVVRTQLPESVLDDRRPDRLQLPDL